MSATASPAPLADHDGSARTWTSEQVAWEQSISVAELLDTHFRGVDPGLSWAIEDVPLDRIDGDYEPRWYYEDEAAYMAALESAIDAGEVPLPAFIRCGDGYDHADGAHRTVVALRRKEAIIRGFVARCPIHARG